MPINKIVASFDEAVADIEDGAVIMVGGFGTVVSTPSCLLEALDRKGVKNLTTVSNSTGFGADVWRIAGAPFPEDMDILVRNMRIKKAIVAAPVSALYVNNFEKLLRAGKVEIEMVPQGTLAERIRAAKAGIGGFYVQVGVGTTVEEGKEKKIIDGREYILELPIKADFALIHAYKGDRGQPCLQGDIEDIQSHYGWRSQDDHCRSGRNSRVGRTGPRSHSDAGHICGQSGGSS